MRTPRPVGSAITGSYVIGSDPPFGGFDIDQSNPFWICKKQVMSSRLITPSQPSLFSISPVIGACTTSRCYSASSNSRSIASPICPASNPKPIYTNTKEAMASGVEFIHQVSLCNDEMCGSGNLPRRIEKPFVLGALSQHVVHLII